MTTSTIYGILTSISAFSQLKIYVDKVDTLKTNLDSAGNKYTMIAPLNDGFSPSLIEFLKDETKLEEYLNFLMIKGEVLTTNFDDLNHATEHATAKMRLCFYGTTYVAQGALLSSNSDDNNKACTNGNIHTVVNAPEMPKGTIYEYISNGENKEKFTKLKKALDKANFNTKNTLTGDMPVTFFAPTDAALNKIADIDKKIDSKCNVLITALMGNHMIIGGKTYYSAGIVNAQTIITYWNNDANNQLKMAITGEDGEVYTIGTTNNETQSKIVTKDVSVSNGVIHIIDNVLEAKDMPKPFYCK